MINQEKLEKIGNEILEQLAKEIDVSKTNVIQLEGAVKGVQLFYNKLIEVEQKENDKTDGKDS